MSTNHRWEPYSHWRPEETRIVDDRPVRYQDVCVHEILISDVEDPDVYVAEPLYEWTQSEAGRWIMANAEETPYWIRNTSFELWGHCFRVMARLSEANHVFWQLKWGNK